MARRGRGFDISELFQKYLLVIREEITSWSVLVKTWLWKHAQCQNPSDHKDPMAIAIGSLSTQWMIDQCTIHRRLKY